MRRRVIYGKDVIYACRPPRYARAQSASSLRMRAERVEAPQRTAALLPGSMDPQGAKRLKDGRARHV